VHQRQKRGQFTRCRRRRRRPRCGDCLPGGCYRQSSNSAARVCSFVMWYWYCPFGPIWGCGWIQGCPFARIHLVVFDLRPGVEPSSGLQFGLLCVFSQETARVPKLGTQRGLVQGMSTVPRHVQSGDQHIAPRGKLLVRQLRRAGEPWPSVGKGRRGKTKKSPADGTLRARKMVQSI
jgi:hypothetical protein